MALKEASVQFELGVECCGILPSRMLSSHLNFSEIPWHFVGICWFEISDLEKAQVYECGKPPTPDGVSPSRPRTNEALRRLERLAEETELLVSRRFV